MTRVYGFSRGSLGIFLIFLMLTACAREDQRSRERAVFDPYDYEKGESANIRFPKAKSSIKLDRDEFILRRKIPLPPLK